MVPVCGFTKLFAASPTADRNYTGVLQTVMRLSVSLGLSITTALFGSSSRTMQAAKDITFAYDRAFICSIVFASAGLLIIPFLRIEKSGVQNSRTGPEMEENGDSQSPVDPITAGEYRDNTPPSSIHSEEDLRWDEESDKTSIMTCATRGNETRGPPPGLPKYFTAPELSLHLPR